jgi:hypothetical protein
MIFSLRSSFSQATSRYSVTFATLVLMLYGIVSQAASADVSEHFREKRVSAVAATVVTLPPLYFTATQMTEEQLGKFGCTFKVVSQQDLDSLFDIVIGAQIGEVESPYKFGPDPRLAVYLTFADGVTEKMLFEGIAPVPVPVYGSYNGTVSVRAMNPNFATELRAWSYARKPEPGIKCKENLIQVTPEPKT